jgi:hypothetical protein
MQCPLCKVPSFFARAEAGTTHEVLRHTLANKDLLWRACVGSKEDEHDSAAVLCCGEFMPVIIYACGAQNAAVIDRAMRITDGEKRTVYLAQALQSPGDSLAAQGKRKSAVISLARLHESVSKRRRLGMLVLDEAQDLVTALEEDEGESPAAQVFVVVLLTRSQGADPVTHIWLRPDIGGALGQALRACCSPDFVGMSIIACEDTAEGGAPLSAVVAVLPQSMPPPAAVESLMRQFRQPHSDALSPADADALIMSMHHGLNGLGSTPFELRSAP